MAMQRSRLERENLEAHVDLCAERYRVLEDKLDRLSNQMESMEDAIQKMSEKAVLDTKSNNKVLIGSAATVIAGLLSTIVLLLLNLNFTPLG